MSEKICPGCGAKIESTSNICAYCGHDLKLGGKSMNSSSPVEIFYSEATRYLQTHPRDVRGFFFYIKQVAVNYGISNVEDLTKLVDIILANVKIEDVPLYGAGYKSLIRTYDAERLARARVIADQKEIEAHKKEAELAIQNLTVEYAKINTSKLTKEDKARFDKKVEAKKKSLKNSYPGDSLDYKDFLKGIEKEIKGTKTAAQIKKDKAVKFVIAGSAVAAVGAIVLIGHIPVVDYSIEGDSAVCNGVKGLIFDSHFDMKEVEVKEEYQGKPVRSIGYHAFLDEDAIEKIVLPSTITGINESAFYGMDSLKEINLEDTSLTYLGNNALGGCYELEEIYLPDTVTTIGEEAFSNTNISKISLPDSVERIGSHAFAWTNIKELYLPENITEIGSYILDGNYEENTIYYPGSYQDFQQVNGAHNYINSYDNQMKYDSVKIFNTETGQDVYANKNSLPTLEHKEKPGYVFKGFYDGVDDYWGIKGVQITDETGKITASLFEQLRTQGKELNATPYYEVINYNVTYNYNGADTTSYGSGTYNVENSSLSLPNSHSKTGYTFKGWYLDSDFSGQNYTYNYTIDKENPSNLTFYAKWTPNTYSISTSISNSQLSNRGDMKVIYDPNYEGASITTTTFNTSTSYYYNSVPSRDGYQFVGWYYDTEFTKPFKLTDVYYSFNKEHRVYARWVEIPEDCDYVLSNMTSSYSDYDCVQGETIKKILIDVPGNVTLKLSNGYSSSDIKVLDKNDKVLYSRENVALTSQEIKLTNVELGDVITIITNADVSYEYMNVKYDTDAEYSKINSSTSYYMNFYNSTISTNVNVNYDSSYTLKYAEIPGYTFKGYYTSSNGGGTRLTDETGKSLSTYNDTYGITAYAYYTSGATYSINYNGIEDYDYSGSLTETYDYGTTTTLPTLTKYGYEFLGWCTDKELKTTPKTSLSSTDFGDKVLYPKFKPGQYKVSYSVTDSYLSNATKKIVFDLNYEGGSTSYSTKTVKNGDSFSYPSNPSRSGYYFAGWYSDKEGLVPFSIETVQSGPLDQKVYAKWIDNSSNYALTSNYSSYNNVYVNYSSYSSKTFMATSTNPIFYYYNYYSGSYYSINFTIYNETQGTTITTQTNTSSSSNYVTLTGVNAGDIITLKYKMASNNTNYLYYKFTEYSSSYVYFTSTVNGTAVVGYEQDYELSYVELPGREFKGYYTQSNGTGIRLTDETGKSISGYNYSKDLTVYPYYVEADPYKITYEGMEDSETTLEDEYTYGVGLDLENPTRTGYDFDGWYLEDSYSTKVTSISTTDFGDKTLYAKWTPKKYKLTYSVGDSSSRTMRIYFDENYSGGSVYSIDITSGSTVSLPSVSSRSYYVFLGWYLDSACTTPFTGDYSALTYGDTLYAKWSEYNSTYGNGTSSYTSTYSISLSSSYSTYYRYFTVNQKSLSLNLYTYYTSNSYKVYVGVYNATKGTTIYGGYVQSSKTISLSSCDVGDQIYFYTYRYSSSNTLYYYFTGTSVTSYSNVNTTFSDANFIASTEVDYNSDFTIEPISKSGYTFAGYYTGANGTGIKITDNTGASVSKYAYTSDLTVYPYFI